MIAERTRITMTTRTPRHHHHAAARIRPKHPHPQRRYPYPDVVTLNARQHINGWPVVSIELARYAYASGLPAMKFGSRKRVVEMSATAEATAS